MRPLILFVALAAAGAAPTSLMAATAAVKDDVERYAAQLLENNYRPDGPGAAILVARGDEVLFRGARGMSDVNAKTPLKPGDVFRIGSVSKQFSAAGLLKLVEAGKVSLSDPLSRFVPDFPNGKRITVLELLNHTSGVKSYTGLPDVMAGPIDKDLSTAQLIATFKEAKVDFAPGEGWAYNNSGYVLVGAVIEAASGKSWHQYLHEALFVPLGMSHTFYGGEPASVTGQVTGWSRDGDKTIASRALSMTFPHAAGALVSSVDDLMKWNRALHEGRVLKSDLYTQMITPVGKAVPAGYGFGIARETLRDQHMLGHGGGIFGFSTMLDYVQGPDVSVVVLQNSDAAVGKDSPETLARKLAAAAIGQPYPAPLAITVAPAELKSLEGVYRIDEKATRVLRVVDGQLTGQRTGGQPAKLIPIGKDEFLYEDGLNRFTIERDAKGAVTGMRFFAQGDGPGVVVVRSNDALPPARAEIQVPAAALERVVGNYLLSGRTMKVFLDGTQLKTQLEGQPAFDLFAETPDRYFLKVVDATLEFAAGAQAAPMVTLHQAGQRMEFTRAP